MTQAEEDSDFIPGPDNQFFTTREVAAMFSVTAATVSGWYREGKLKAVKLDNGLRFPERIVRRYAQERYGDGSAD